MPSTKSSCLMISAERRNASMPASTHTALSIAPLNSSVERASSWKFTSPSSTFILREWICKMRARADSVGSGSSILRSRRPDRSSAGSSMSGRLVAAITFTIVSLSNPSSWFSSSSIVRCTSRSLLFSPPPRLVPMASSSSMKMIAPPRSLPFSRASSKASRTSFAPSPMNICTSCVPASFKNTASDCFAHARASSVFPVPGGPCSSTPFGGWIPIDLNRSACVMGSTTASTSSWICLPSPPISEYSSSGFSSSSMALTRLSYSAGSLSRIR
mmetsp:Transcript_67398/g.163043  ORF Transcript_67398/g.163043 Transcript_67398/m.163043 type:complete len:272 (+) Transcript_67398:108-923(+)